MKNCVKVKFNGSDRIYSFLNDIEGLKEGDIVVVDTKNGLCLCTVVEVTLSIPKIATAWIVNRVDVEKVNTKKEVEKKIKYLKEQMEERVVEIKEQQRMKEFARIDPTYSELLSELSSLLGIEDKEEQTPTEEVSVRFPQNIGNFNFTIPSRNIPSEVLSCVYNPKTNYHEVTNGLKVLETTCDYNFIHKRITDGYWKIAL